MSKDIYAVLGVDRNATQDEIRKAYLKLAHKYHPDKTGGDKNAEDRLKEINAAYDVLKNPEKRAQYDRFGTTDGQPFTGGGGFGGAGFGGAGFEAPFEDFFDMLFGQGGGRRRQSSAQQGNDLELRMSITLKEAATGAKKKIRYNRNDTCGECRGTGAAKGSSPQTCEECGGAGQVRMAQSFFSVTRTCPRCHGTGQSISNPCKNCSGKGVIRAQRELSVDVPAGVDTGARLRVTQEGEPGINNGPRGDLYIHIEVEAHEFFERDGATILCELPITFAQAALGATVRVPTLNGEAELKIPPGTQSGSQLRLRGLGMPDLRGYRQGDQIVQINVETPVKLSRQQQDLLKKFEEEGTAKNYPHHNKFSDKRRASQH